MRPVRGGAKVATATLHFLKPETWGVVDWRTAAMLGFRKKSNYDVNKALTLARMRMQMTHIPAQLTSHAGLFTSWTW
jgi:hypothetical protein